MSTVNVEDIVKSALKKYLQTTTPPGQQMPYFPPSPYYHRPATTMRGVPIYVLGRDPPYVGDLIGYQPHYWNGTTYYTLYAGWIEVWAQIRDEDDNVVAYYPYFVRGLPSIGALIAHEHAQAIRGNIILFEMGIQEPFTSVTVPERSILWLNKVFDGTMRAIIADPNGILTSPDYELAVRYNQLNELVRMYAYNAHVLDGEVRQLRSLVQAKDVEVRKYRDLLEESEQRYRNVLGRLLEVRYELERIQRYLEYLEKQHIADREAISYLSDENARLLRIVKDIISVMEASRQLVNTTTVNQLTKALETVRTGKKAKKPVAPVQQTAQPAGAPPQAQGGGYVS
jgi:hypothetical protein